MQNHSEIHHTQSAEYTQDSAQTQQKSNIGLLSLVNEVKGLLETKHNKKIEDLEFMLLEKEEAISQLTLELSTLKAQGEEKDLELYRIREEINQSKQLLEQFISVLNKTQE